MALDNALMHLMFFDDSAPVCGHEVAHIAPERIKRFRLRGDHMSLSTNVFMKMRLRENNLRERNQIIAEERTAEMCACVGAESMGKCKTVAAI